MTDRPKICRACGHPATPADPVIPVGGTQIHHSHTTDPRSGFYGAQRED
jgi:hypothetical protein